MKDSSMHRTPDVPGTGPVTDNPNPGGSQGSEPGGPGTDLKPAGEISRDQNIGGGASSTGGGGDIRTFRCGDAGNADCRWEVSGRTEDELRPQIHPQRVRQLHTRSLPQRIVRRNLAVHARFSARDLRQAQNRHKQKS